MPPRGRDGRAVLITPNMYTKQPNGCWCWNGKPNHAGYGRISIGSRGTKKDWLAHRRMYFEKTGETPEAVRHTCDNPPCVNPDHLIGGTQLENIQDMLAKGRYRHHGGFKGEAHGRAKLTNQDVREIRDLAAWGVTQKQLAKEYGMSTSQISNVVRKAQWLDEGYPQCPHGIEMELEVK